MSEGLRRDVPESLVLDRPEKGQLPVRLQRAALILYILVLAWAPFPLGSDVAWGAPALEIAIGACWVLWAMSTAFEPRRLSQTLRLIALPGLCIGVVLVWIVIQAFASVPLQYADPVWQIASSTLPISVAAHLSINPSHTRLELLKLILLVEAFWLSLAFSSRRENARILLISTVGISSAYALYACGLVAFHTSQATLLYSTPPPSPLVSGPFMLHNSFATFCGLGSLAALAGLLHSVGKTMVTQRGPKQLAVSVLSALLGPALYWFISFLLLFAALVASASRGGLVSGLVGLTTITIGAAVRQRRTTGLGAALSIAGLLIPFVLSLLLLGGDMNLRLSEFARGANLDEIRSALWAAGERMISVFPYTGLGLGTFEDAYPMFAVRVFPFDLDKAHCDYLEFVAGIGIPAATTWLLGIAGLGVTCLRGFRTRRRDWLFPLLGFAALALVAAHSTVDFSLQIPAVGLMFVTLFGMGVGQSRRTQELVRVPPPVAAGIVHSRS